MIKAVIFDFDGLIIDTETPWYIAYKEAFKKYKVDLPLDVWGRCIGTSFDVFNPIDYLERESGQTIDREQIRVMTKEIYAQQMTNQSVRPGVIPYMTQAKELGLSIGLASSSHLSWVEPYLAKYGLLQYFDTIITADRVQNVKPDPELYLTAMGELEVTGPETVAFEDSLNGLTAAKAAGAYCVIVPNEVTSYMNFKQYDLRLTSMEEIELTKILEHVSQ